MRPELLSPAGSPEALRAAVQNGADAVYLGWGTFNARQGAKNFSDAEFADALLYCHERGVRVFLTLNTLVTDRELPRALDTAAAAARLGVDAVLVQDWGLFLLLRQMLPDLPVHASTQMSAFTAGAAKLLAADGCERVVLARECSAADTAAICAACPAEIEIFAHGALCMCYSGQCEMSALIGGRSGNRGRCAQPCRLPYAAVGGKKGNPYPLSLKDNCMAASLEEAAEMGVSCLKLEGRMKRPEYVAVVTRIYDRLLSEGRGPTAAEAAELEAAFSRSGFTDGYWQGHTGKDMFGTRPAGAADPRELFEAAKAAYEKGDMRTVGVDLSCTVAAGVPCALTAADRDGHAVTVTGPVPEAARTRALTGADLEARLRKTGGTAYRCETVVTAVDEGLSLSASAVNGLRRDALAALTAARTAPPARRLLPQPPAPEDTCSAAEPALTVSVARRDQLTEDLLSLGPARVYVPLEVLADMDALPAGRTEWCAALPRVWRDRDEETLRSWLERAGELGVTGALLGNIGHVPLTEGLGLTRYGDFGLNVFNSRSLEYLRRKGLQGACVSFELRFSQIRDLAKCLPAEAIVYGRLPLMITEHDLTAGGVTALRDRTGAEFPLLSAFGRRTEIQNSRPLWLADRTDWRRLGLAHARLRFTTETAAEGVRVFRDYLTGAAPEGTFTRGLYERGVE